MMSIIDSNTPITTYLINLDHRIDRRQHILKEFKDRSEFKVKLYPAIKHEFGNVGLWLTIREIISYELNTENEFIIICEDDHEFTASYDQAKLFQSITSAQRFEPDVILGGMSWFHSSVQVDRDLFWVDTFNGFQFTILKRSIFERIINYEYDNNVHSDYVLSSISDKKFCLYPFISKQKEFGYSDINQRNSESGYLNEIFSTTEAVLKNHTLINKVYGIGTTPAAVADIGDEDIKFPVNLIRYGRDLSAIEKQFSGKPEFILKHFLLRDEEQEINTWNTVVTIIEQAVADGDDFAIVATEAHRFTSSYAYQRLISAITNAHYFGATILTGISEGEDQLIYIGADIFWINSISSLKFLVLYGNLFGKILNYNFKTNDSVIEVLSNLTTNKLAVFPFFSTPDAAVANPHRKRFYASPELRFEKIKEIKLSYSK